MTSPIVLLKPLDIRQNKTLCLKIANETSAKESPPVVRTHSTVDHAYVFSDGLHFVDTLLIIQNGLLFLLCCQDNSIGS